MANATRNKVKPHILLIRLALVAFNSYWCLMGTEVWHSTQLTIASLFFNAVFTLLVFVLVNLLLRQLVSKGSCAKNRGRETLPAGGAVLFRADFRGLYVWVRVEFNRLGAANADVYCVALRHYNDV